MQRPVRTLPPGDVVGLWVDQRLSKKIDPMWVVTPPRRPAARANPGENPSPAGCFWTDFQGSWVFLRGGGQENGCNTGDLCYDDVCDA